MPSPATAPPRRWTSLALVAVLAFCLTATDAAAVEQPRGSAKPKRPNVLVISIDSLRRDFVGSYGARLPHAPDASPTPTLDAIARSGARFADAYAPSPWTLPSHVSLLTGQSPMVHGVESDLVPLDPRHSTLAEMLRAHGYRTAGVFSGPYLDPHWGFDRGFESYRASYGDAVEESAESVDGLDLAIAEAERKRDATRAEQLRWLRREVFVKVRERSHADVSSEAVTAVALKDMERLAAAGDPWMLFVHYFDVHYDYVPPPPWDTRFDPGYRGSMSGRGFLSNPAIAVPDAGQADGFIRRVSHRDLEHLLALYAGEIAWVDSHVGRLMERLAALGLDRSTLVVVVSDHGDEFFEHGGIGHRRNVYEEVIRIPMLVRLPGVIPAGREVRGPVTLADVVPTVLEAAGLPARQKLSGRSLLPAARGGALEERPLVARLVRMHPGEVTFEEDGTRAPIQVAVVHETFLSGSIKILRRRHWPLYPPGIPEDRMRRLRAAADEQFRDEELLWIDLARHPAEPLGAYSTVFDDRRAAAALAAYRERYAALALRLEPGAAPAIAPALRSALEGLGYVDGSVRAPTSSREGFVLPPPGPTEEAR